jgi:hypothetical protein
MRWIIPGKLDKNIFTFPLFIHLLQILDVHLMLNVPTKRKIGLAAFTVYRKYLVMITVLFVIYKRVFRT